MNVFLAAALTLSTSIQIALVCSQLFPVSSLTIFMVFIASFFSLSVFMVFALNKEMQKFSIDHNLLVITAFECICTYLMLSAAFKMIIYDNSPQLAKASFWVIAAISFIYKFVWPWVNDALVWVWSKWQGMNEQKILKRIIDGVFIAFIIGIVAVLDPKRIVALSFIGEQWHHLDYFIMSPGLSVIHGGRPYVDVLSQYGVGIPFILAHMMQWSGGFDYVHAVAIVIVCGVIYFVASYVFLRWWLTDIALSLAAVLTMIRINLCHYGVSPLVWIYPSTSPIRLCFDIAFVALLLIFIKIKQLRWLIIAGIWSGLSIFFMSSTGISMVLAFYAFVIMTFILVPGRLVFEKNNLLKTVLLFSLPVIFSIGGIAWAVGSAVLDQHFWSRWGEYMNYFANGHAGGVLPFYDSLKYRNYLSWIMGAIMPIGYLLSTMYALSLWWRGKMIGLMTVIVAIGIYGLGQYSYYVVRSAQTSYYMVGLPLVWLAAFWLKIWLDTLPQHKSRAITLGLLLVSAYALFTNHNYLSYPSLISLSKDTLVDKHLITRFPDRQGYFNHQVKHIKPEDKMPVNNLGNTSEDILTEDDFTTEVQLLTYVKQASDFSQDAQLIESLTAKNERVALVSSFETAILIQANRGPFFYHTPLTTSRPMNVRTLPSDAAHSPRFLTDTIQQLKEHPPKFVFTEKILLNDQYPASYTLSQANIIGIMAYIKEHYKPVKEGQYLIAWSLIQQ